MRLFDYLDPVLPCVSRVIPFGVYVFLRTEVYYLSFFRGACWMKYREIKLILCLQIKRQLFITVIFGVIDETGALLMPITP